MAERDPAPAPPAKRSDSLYERLKARGWPLLNEVMSMLGVEDDSSRKRTRKTHRFLNAIGFKEQSESALTDMRHECRRLWIYERTRHEVEELPIPDDADEVAAKKFRQEMILQKMEAATAEDLLASEKMETERTKREVSLRGVAVREETLELRVYESQQRGAQEIDAILENAEKLKELQEERAGMKKAGATDAEIITAIQKRVYGANAVLLQKPSTTEAAA